jgi:hypothetical protein
MEVASKRWLKDGEDPDVPQQPDLSYKAPGFYRGVWVLTKILKKGGAHIHFHRLREL